VLPYGDQGLLISRRLFDQLGGYQPLVLMEDVDLVRRIGRRRLTILDHDAVTSAERFLRDGYVRRTTRNLACLGLFYAGMAPDRIARFYR
ncbi:MAG TPA: glycosyl transferase family 2, partial [Aestuariivirgaceae bacterium]|nr:glycosyl transferase family 2 [Aestuariivirgaceae bacterium]